MADQESLLQIMGKERTCVLCQNPGTLAGGGLKCHMCDVFFHKICIDPLRSTPIPDISSGHGILYVCSDCGDVLDDEIAVEDNPGQDEVEVEEKDNGDSSDSDDDEEDKEFIEDDDEVAAKLRAGEPVWTKNDCPCETCHEMNEAERLWPAYVEMVRRGEGNILFRSMVKGIESREDSFNQMLSETLFAAGLPAMTRDQISRRGRL